MITRETVRAQLLAYLNDQITLAELVNWAENCFTEGGFVPDEDTMMLRDMVAYLAAADTTGFPLTWDVCSDFLKQLGSHVQVIAV
jgi:hypothetical protein